MAAMAALSKDTAVLRRLALDGATDDELVPTCGNKR